MNTKKTYSYRAEEETKNEFEKICTKHGITPSIAIAMYMTYVARTKEIPAIFLAPDIVEKEAK